MKNKVKIGLFVALISLFVFQVANAASSLFQPYVSFPLGNAQAVGIGDFNNDGLNDVAITSPNQLSIYLQNNAGGLASPAVYPSTYRPESLAVGDFNNDGQDDVVIGDVTTNTISLYLQQPDGVLASRVTFPTGSGPDAIVVGDLNGDGLDDVAVSNWNSPYISIFTQSITGTLNSQVTYASPQAGYDDIAIGDVNDDGRNDVVKMNGQGLNPNLSVYLQNTEGTLSPAQSYSITNCSYCLSHGVETGDVTGDGRTDVVVSYGGNKPSSGIAVFPQGLDGILQPAINYPAEDIPEPVEIADVNADGVLDVLSVHGGHIRVSVFLQLNSGSGSYSTYTVPSASHYKPQGFDIGDINNDSLPDMVIADYNNGLVVLYHMLDDHTPPAIAVTATKADGTAYVPDTWTNQIVTLKYTCSDTGSGIASCPANQVFSVDGVNTSVTGTVTDNAGNTATVTFGPIKIDKTPPALFASVSPNPVLLNGNADLLTNATDKLSGIKSGSMPCSNIDTSTVGGKSVQCWVLDNAGNQTTTIAPYQVIYAFEGFLSPVIDCVNNRCDSYEISSFSVSSTISVRFRLKDANGNIVLPANALLWLAPFQIQGTLPVTFPNGYTFQTTGIAYTWKKSQNFYVYDWSTRRLPSRTNWLVGVKLDDGKTYYVFVALK
jgi:hypothetical protein